MSGTTTKAVTLTATDATSGVASIEYQIGDAATWTTYSTPLTFSNPGTYVVRYRATDEASNTHTGELSIVVAKKGGPTDVVKPTVTIAMEPAAPNGRGGWYTSPVTFTLTGSGGQGELKLEYRLGSGNWTVYTEPFTVATNGSTQVQARATDATGTVSAIQKVTVKIDITAPTVTVSGLVDDARLSLAAARTPVVTTADATSGIAQRVVRLDGELVKLLGAHRCTVAAKREAPTQGQRDRQGRQPGVEDDHLQGGRQVRRSQASSSTGSTTRRRSARILGAKFERALNAAKSADRSDDERQASQALKRFKRLASSVEDDEARRALKTAAVALQARL